MTQDTDVEILRIQDLAPDAGRAPVQFEDDGPVYRMASIRSMSFRDRSEHDHHFRRWMALQKKDIRRRLTRDQQRQFEDATDALMRVALPDLPEPEIEKLRHFEKEAVITAFRAAFLGGLMELGKAAATLITTDETETSDPDELTLES